MAPILSIPLRRRLSALSEHDLGAIQEASLRLLAEVGVAIDSAELRGRMSESGAVDRGDGRILLPPALVERALAAAPRGYTLAARDPQCDLRLDGTRCYLSVDGSAAEILDPRSGERRVSTLADVAAVTRLADAIEEIAFVWQPVAARDVSQPIASLYELREQLLNTRKHVQVMTATSPLAARGVVEVARAAAGGAGPLCRRPIVSSFQCSLSPLTYEPEALEAALVFAEAGIPAGFVAMPIAGATAPITPEAALVQTNAEVLAGVVVLETLVPGAPTFYGACTTVMDLHSGAPACGGPEDLFFQMTAAQLAASYRLPASIGTFASGSRRTDWQSGLENGLSGLASCLAGAEMLCGAGLLHAAQVFSPLQMVLDAETFRLLACMLELLDGAQAGDEARAAPAVIADVGPGGHFLAADHTLENLARLWQPRCFDRLGDEAWERAGRPGPLERAAERMSVLLNKPAPPCLAPEEVAEVDRIIREYELQVAVQRPAAGRAR